MKRPAQFLSALAATAALIGLTSVAAPAEAREWTLSEALAHAATNSPDARIAEVRIRAAQARVQEAGSAYWPGLRLESSYIRTDNPVTVFGSVLNQRAFSPGLDFNHVPDVDNWNSRGVLTLPLYTGGQRRARQSMAGSALKASRREAEAVQNALSFEIVRTFHSAAKVREFVKAGEAAMHGFEAGLLTASNRLQAGTILRAELLDVSVRLAQAREETIRSRNAVQLANRAAATLLGLEETEFEIAATPSDIPEPGSGESGSRPELQAAQERLNAAQSGISAARGAGRPQIGAFGTLEQDRGWRLDGDGGSYTAGVRASWDIWDGRLTRARVAGATADRDAAEEQLRKIRLMIQLETEQARLNLKAARQRLTVAREAVNQAAESVALTRSRFEQGLAIATQLIDSETALTSARVRQAEAEADQRIAVAALRQALGLPQIPQSHR